MFSNASNLGILVTIMAKNSSIFICQSCGAQFSSWMGKCSSCGEWNTITEELKIQDSKNQKSNAGRSLPLTSLLSVSQKPVDRIKTGIQDFDNLLGGGIVKGSLVLLSGEPGIGKSTILMQIAQQILTQNTEFKIVYVSGEESPEQLSIRSRRLFGEKTSDRLFVGSETNIDNISYTIAQEKPTVVIIDSIQTVYSENMTSFPGSVTQVRYATNVLMSIAKKQNIPIILVGQVTKEGVVAGPKVLEHMVDVVLQFEGSQSESYRILRPLKNRFGNTEDISFFEMQEKGLFGVGNPSALFLETHEQSVPGSVKTVFVEGNRSLLVEVQALVSPNYAPPLRRVAMGIDYNRLLLLVAVIEKRLRINLQSKDVHVKISGGMKISDPAIDLAVCLAIISAYYDEVINSKVVAFGEVGLLGELRKVKYLEKRKQEATKQGFDQVLASDRFQNLKSVLSYLKFKL